MISYEPELIFVHIPKCAGTTIEHAFIDSDYKIRREPSFGMGPNKFPWKGPPRLAHLTAHEYLKFGYLTEAQWKRFPSFAVTRCPWARLVSEYNWRSEGRMWRLRNRRPWSFKEFLVNFPSRSNDNYLTGSDSFRHVIPQSDFIYDQDGVLLVDAVFSLETFGSKLPVWLKEHGLPEVKFEQSRNPSKFRDPNTGLFVDGRLPLSDYYCQEAVSFVETYYSSDLSLLGYRRPF